MGLARFSAIGRTRYTRSKRGKRMTAQSTRSVQKMGKEGTDSSAETCCFPATTYRLTSHQQRLRSPRKTPRDSKRKGQDQDINYCSSQSQTTPPTMTTTPATSTGISDPAGGGVQGTLILWQSPSSLSTKKRMCHYRAKRICHYKRDQREISDPSPERPEHGQSGAVFSL